MSWVSDNEKKYIDFMRNTKVSIIIPIYNVEKYLEECIDSAINQTYSNLEIILVDDKSPDSSGKISDKYAKKDDRIKVIHKRNNGGLSAARNTGIKYSTGDLLMFVDSDDILHRDAVSILSNKL
ncbi:MAG TPA: glycosyltransferase family 2 protein, partial [Flavobacterium sp.]|nr:glycosyltransferase family 2 protein [Flavobacterium sp.]